MAKGILSPLMRKYNALRRIAKKQCEGKATATQVNAAKSSYVKAATAKGQTTTSATAKANRVIKCPKKKAVAGVSALAGRKRKPGRPRKK